ncbi:EboA domain-containing protein [Pedobacter sp. PWIIR3]
MWSTGTEELIKIGQVFLSIIKKNLQPQALEWLEAKAALVKTEDKSLQLNMAFSNLPKHTGKAEIIAADLPADGSFAGFSLAGWSIDRLCRVWLLMQLNSTDKAQYLKKIEALFSAAEMNELVALYSALPFYAYAEEWVSRCETGIRSNIGTVLESIMYHNPYPAAYLSENSWNQLILKAFFTEKDVTKITGLETRINQPLQNTLRDYIAERTAAHRTVEPNIYKLIALNNQNI